MKNYERILKKVYNNGYDMGIYDKRLNKLNQQNLKKVLDNIDYQCDTKIFINRKPFIVEISECDNEIDFNILSLSEYESRYGTWED